MKQAVNPAVAGVIIAVVAVVALLLIGWNYLGPRTDGPAAPVDMKQVMGKDKLAPPSDKGGPIKMGAPKQ